MNKKINNWLIKGDCHGDFEWMTNIQDYDPFTTAIVILGDVGFNYYLNNKDVKLKEEVNARGYRIYCVRGNHEARPQDIEHMIQIYDPNVDGEIYMEEAYPNIRYFFDFGIYTLNHYKCAVIGGAYSVDKYWRLQKAGVIDKKDPNWFNPKKTGWFYNEQLSQEEMDAATAYFKDQTVDFIFSHTCPFSWEPTDLFLAAINQKNVDNSMEIWLDEIKDTFNWFIWCFGHFHADRLERPYVEQYFHDIENLEEIYTRWQKYKNTNKLDWWLSKSPQFYYK